MVILNADTLCNFTLNTSATLCLLISIIFNQVIQISYRKSQHNLIKCKNTTVSCYHALYRMLCLYTKSYIMFGSNIDSAADIISCDLLPYRGPESLHQLVPFGGIIATRHVTACVCTCMYTSMWHPPGLPSPARPYPCLTPTGVC